MATDTDAEKAAVEATIRDCIEWPFPEKNVDRLFSSVARDSSFFIFHPDSKSTIVGFDAFRNTTENFFMSDACRPLETIISELRITLSKSGEAAWFSCMLDDRGEMNGVPWEWLNTRWTGVLEKQDGKWRIYQMHFSFASDAAENESTEDSTANKQ